VRFAAISDDNPCRGWLKRREYLLLAVSSGLCLPPGAPQITGGVNF